MVRPARKGSSGRCRGAGQGRRRRAKPGAQRRLAAALDLGADTVNISIYSFYPAKRTVKAGTTVTWVNNDEAEHTVVSAEGSYASQPLKTRNVKPGDHYSVTFVTPGTFAYYCSIHPSMKGVIEVTN